MSTPNQLDQLKQFTKVVADTGDFASMKQYAPRDATTNPSLILKAAAMPDYAWLMDKAVKDAGATGASCRTGHRPAARALRPRDSEDRARAASRPRSTPAFPSIATAPSPRPARSSRSTKKPACPRERILIKIASTWEGIKAAELLQKEKINCNLTLLFSFAQAVACAEAEGHAHLAVRRPHSRLVQEEHRQGLRPDRGPGRQVGHGDLHLLQEIRLQDRGHGRHLPQQGRNHRTRRLRPAHHQPALARRTEGQHRSARAQTRSGQAAKSPT